MTDPPEKNDSLWILVVSPAIWAAHFLLSYATAAIWCAKLAAGGSLDGARLAIGIYTAAALIGIGINAWLGHRKWSIGSTPHHLDSAEARHRFLGIAAVLLAGLSAVATIYVSLAAVFIRNCN